MKLLPVIVPPAAPPPFMATAVPVRFDEGFYDEEGDAGERFRWMRERGVLTFEPGHETRFLELRVLSEFRDLSQTLQVSAGADAGSYRLATGWAPLSLVVPAGAMQVELSVNKIFPAGYYAGDRRTLAVRIGDVRLHADPERHTAVLSQYRNAVLNQQELLDGRTELTSTPPSLGIDLHGVCNVKPPCVYCEWDASKGFEGDRATVPFTRETLREWGAFFDNSVNLINCSIGEPFMMKNLDELLEVFGRTGKRLEMTTNGQILTDRNIQKLLGLPIDLYVSLDAATAETYAKLRNNTFDKLLHNLRRMIAAKGGRGRLPHVHLVFMPMRANVHELEDFIRLAADLNADRLVLRPLNYSDSTTLDWERGGYHFEYKNELLPFEEMVRASGRAARLCRDLGVDLADQMNFGGSMRDLFRDDFDADSPASAPASGRAAAPVAPEPVVEPEGPDAAASAPAEPALPSLGAEHQPACLEPWKSLYILRRGVLPCCYGAEALTPMENYRAAWNSAEMQSIRRELLRGRFHDYCLRSSSCPIVRKAEEAQLLPPWQRVLVKGRHVWARFNRETGEVPNRYFYFPIKRTVIRGRRALTQPGYIGKHSRRLWAQWRGR